MPDTLFYQMMWLDGGDYFLAKKRWPRKKASRDCFCRKVIGMARWLIPQLDRSFSPNQAKTILYRWSEVERVNERLSGYWTDPILDQRTEEEKQHLMSRTRNLYRLIGSTVVKVIEIQSTRKFTHNWRIDHRSRRRVPSFEEAIQIAAGTAISLRSHLDELTTMIPSEAIWRNAIPLRSPSGRVELYADCGNRELYIDEEPVLTLRNLRECRKVVVRRETRWAIHKYVRFDLAEGQFRVIRLILENVNKTQSPYAFEELRRSARAAGASEGTAHPDRVLIKLLLQHPILRKAFFIKGLHADYLRKFAVRKMPVHESQPTHSRDWRPILWVISNLRRAACASAKKKKSEAWSVYVL